MSEDVESAQTETADANPPDSAGQEESVTFARCADCVHGEEVDSAAGRLLCKKHDMRVDAEADEIPDDCVAYEAKGD